MKEGGLRMDPQRAKNIGKMLFAKFDTSKKGYLQPRQCYEVFSDYCYRILNISNPPTMEEAQSMHSILDFNHDNRVTESDLQSLAVKYLCQQSNKLTSLFTQTREYKSITATQPPQRTYTKTAQKRLDVIKRLFKAFDKDNSGYLTQNEIPGILIQTYKEIGNASFQPTREDVKSYMRMVDKNEDGKVTLEEFQDLVLLSLKKAGFEIYE